MPSSKLITRLGKLEAHRRAMTTPDGRCAICADHRVGGLRFVLPGEAPDEPTPCPACGEDANTYFLIQEAVDPRVAAPVPA
jgi:hypothetical protein